MGRYVVVGIGDLKGGSSRLSENSTAIPSALCNGGCVLALPDGVALAERVQVSAVREYENVSGSRSGVAAVPGVPLPGFGHSRNRDASDAHVPARLVLGSLFGGNSYTRFFGAAAATAARP